MCLPSAKPAAALPPVPPPPAAPPPPPPEPTKANSAVRKAKTNARATAARAAGRTSTLLGGQISAEPSNQTGKTLLGQ